MHNITNCQTNRQIKPCGKNKCTSVKLKLASLVGVAAILLGGCTMHQPSYQPTVLRNKITVAETVERLELYAGQAGMHLSARDQDAVGDFLAQYAASGEGPLYINVPSSGVDSPGVNQARSIVQSYLGRLGMSGAAVQNGQYPAMPGAPAPVIVSYRRLTTAAINCQQGASLTHIGNNQPYGNFGCAQTANLAALIDNPRQLLAPYAFDNASAVRRMTVIDNYVLGEATATPIPDRQEVSASASSGG